MDPERRDKFTEDRRDDRGEGQGPSIWEMVVELVHTKFKDGILAE